MQQILCAQIIYRQYLKIVWNVTFCSNLMHHMTNLVLCIIMYQRLRASHKTNKNFLNFPKTVTCCIHKSSSDYLMKNESQEFCQGKSFKIWCLLPNFKVFKKSFRKLSFLRFWWPNLTTCNWKAFIFLMCCQNILADLCA